MTTCPLHNCVLKQRICVTCGFSSVSAWVILHTRQAKFPYTHTQSFQNHYHHWDQPKDFGRGLTSCFSKMLERDGRPMLRGCRYANPLPNSSSCSSSTFCTPSRPMNRSPESPSKYQRGGYLPVFQTICLRLHPRWSPIIPPLPHPQAFLSRAAFLLKQVPIPSEAYICSPITCKLRHEDQEFKVHMGYMVC